MKQPLILSVICLVLCQCKPTKQHQLFTAAGDQVIQVVAEHVDSVGAVMYLWERTDSLANWHCVDSFDVVLGRNGLAPGNDMVGRKIEGDGNAPEGVFTLSRVFSYHPLTDLKMPFEQVDTNDLCVDDLASVHYNTLIDDDTIAVKDYKSFERMQRQDQQYEYGVWVDYNTAPIVPGNGSCIFLHVWKEPGAPTSGCTAMSKQNMLRLIQWLDITKNPVLIQYPAE